MTTFLIQISFVQNATLNRLFQELVVDTHESAEQGIQYLLGRVRAHEPGVEEERIDLEKILPAC